MLVIVFLTTIVMVPAVSFTQQVIASQQMDLDFVIYNDQFVDISITPVVTFDVNFNPDIIFGTRKISRDSENYLTIFLEPDMTFDNTGTFGLNTGITAAYGNQIYFNPDSAFPIGLEIAPDIRAEYSNGSGFDFDAGLYIAFLGGRVINQRLLLDAKLLSDAVESAVSDDILREIAAVIASYYELNGHESDLQVQQFFSELAILLGKNGQEMRIYNAYQKVLSQRSTKLGRDKAAYTGFQFKVGFQTDFSYADANLKLAAIPELTYAGHFGDSVWFDIHAGIDLPAVDYTFGGLPPDVFNLQEMDGKISADLNWFISPVLSVNIGNDALFYDFMSDPADSASPTPELSVTSTLAVTYGVTESVSLEIEMPVHIVPAVNAELGIYFAWDIL